MIRLPKCLLIPSLPLLLLASSCGNDLLPKQYQLGTLRVLALQADTPEVDLATPASTVNITPLVSDLKGGGRTLNWSAEICSDPGVSFGADPNCTGDPTRTTQSGSVTLTGPTFTGRAPSFTVSAPPSMTATILPRATDEQKYNGLAYLVVYRLSAPRGSTTDGSATTSFRRVVLTTRTPRNTNPTLTGATLDGAPLAQPIPTASDRKILPVIGSGAEDYSLRTSGGDLRAMRENITISWFVNGGELDIARTAPGGTNFFKTAPEASVSPFLVLVIRDDRGGVSFFGVPAL